MNLTTNFNFDASFFAGRRPEIQERVLSMSSNIPHVVAFTLTDASDTNNQQKTFYNRANTDALQTSLTANQVACIIVDPDNAYADNSGTCDLIAVGITYTDTSNANASTPVYMNVPREGVLVLPNLAASTTVSGALNRVVGSIVIRNNNASGDGSVKVLLVMAA